MSDTDNLQRWMYDIYNPLKSFHSETALLVTAVGWGKGVLPVGKLFGETKDIANRSAALSKAISRLDPLIGEGSIGSLVSTGKKSPEAYLALAQSHFGASNDIRKDLGAAVFRASDIWGEVVVPTFETVVDKVEDTVDTVAEKADFFTSPVGLLLVLSILVAVILVK